MTTSELTPGGNRNIVRLAGGLLLGGFLITTIATVGFHPGGDEDNHEKIFTDYAEDADWIAVHIVQFIGVVVALAGLLALYRAFRARGQVPVLGLIAAGSAIATAATFAILQAQDGVALKYAVEAWVNASPADEQARFADAESLRWLEWGLQSYFRILFGATLALFGAAILVSRVIPSWLGWLAGLAGALSIVAGVDVGYQGLASGLQDIVLPAFQLTVLVFAIGVLAAGMRDRDADPAESRPPTTPA